MNKAALLIGVSEYSESSGLKPLPSAAEDIQAMQRVLLRSSEFQAEQIRVLSNPQKQDVEAAIYWLFANRQKDDFLLFYFSGHGIKDQTGKLFFSLPSTRKDERGELMDYTAVPATILHEKMNQSRSTCQVLVLDCCFSGAVAKGLTIKDDGKVDIPTHLGGKGRAIFTSSNSIEYSFQKEGLTLSVYTHFFVEGLEKGAADLDGDGLISADELHIYVSDKVKTAAPAMTPQFFPAEQGHRIYLGRSPKDDAQLKYRKDVEQRVSQGRFQVDRDRFSIPARKALDLLIQQLGLSPTVAATIETEVLQPLREYQRKLQEYEQTLNDTLKDEGYPLSSITQDELKNYQALLGLEDEDVQRIESRLLRAFEPDLKTGQIQPSGPSPPTPSPSPPPVLPPGNQPDPSSHRSSPVPQPVQPKASSPTLKAPSPLPKATPVPVRQPISSGRAPERQEVRRGVISVPDVERALSRINRRQFIMWSGLVGIAGVSSAGGMWLSQRLQGSDVVEPEPSPIDAQGSAEPEVAGDFTVPELEPERIDGNTVGFNVATIDVANKRIEVERRTNRFQAVDINGVELVMMEIAGGEFLIGSPDDEPERYEWEGPQHPVTVLTFFMGKYPITQAQWKAVARLPQVEIELDPDPSGFKGGDRPVEMVSWHDATEFCRRLSTFTGQTYRLSTEAEWEYACRAGTTTPFHFGETITTDLANYIGIDFRDSSGRDWSGSYGQGPKGVYRKETTPVGSFGVANAFGLYDMHGNVWEWCEDHWHDNYVDKPEDLKRDGNEPWLSDNEDSRRSLRGGSWDYVPRHCRSAFRVYARPGVRDASFGFRVVCGASRILP